MPSRIPSRTHASPAPIDPGRRLSDTAYARILEHLFDGTLPAGAFVSQSELVELTAIPVAPLRDALRILEAEGILTIQPRSGIQFVKPGLELTKATFQFRQIQECAAVRIYAEAAPDGALDDVAARHLALTGRIEAGGLASPDLNELDALEHGLHHGVIAILRNPLIEASYRRMHNYLCLVGWSGYSRHPSSCAPCASTWTSSKRARLVTPTSRNPPCEPISPPRCNGTWACSERA